MHRSAVKHCEGVKIKYYNKKDRALNGSVLFINYSEFISNLGKEDIRSDKANNVY